MQRIKPFTFIFIVIFCITSTAYSQNISWFEGAWEGKSYLPGSTVMQNYVVELIIYNIKGNKFEGILRTIQPSDTSIHYDCRISGSFYDKYLTINRNKIVYVKDPPDAKWVLSCINCKTTRMSLSIEAGKFFFRGEVKDCYKPCNGIIEFYKDMNQFDTSAKESIYALVNGVQNQNTDAIVIAANNIQPSQDTVKQILQVNDITTNRIPVLAAEDITFSKKSSLPLSQKPPEQLKRNSSFLLIKANALAYRIPILPAGNIVVAGKNSLPISQKPPEQLKRNSPFFLIKANALAYRIHILPAGTIVLRKKKVNVITAQDLAAIVRHASPFFKLKESTSPIVQKKVLPPIDTTTNTNVVITNTTPAKHHDTLTALPAGYAERKKNVVKTLIVNTDSIVLSVYDNGVVDGDIVSVIYNGEVVIDKLSLTARAYTIKIPVNVTGINSIVFHAHNLGEFPPNTAKLEIMYGSKREELTISSDYTVSSTIDIEYKK